MLRRLAVTVPVAMLFCGCASSAGGLARKEFILYFDRNRDGKVDLEEHHFRGVTDADWQLRDDDYNGKYETKVLFGVGVFKSSVDIPVPTDVRIEATR